MLIKLLFRKIKTISGCVGLCLESAVELESRVSNVPFLVAFAVCSRNVLIFGGDYMRVPLAYRLARVLIALGIDLNAVFDPTQYLRARVLQKVLAVRRQVIGRNRRP